MNGRVAAASQVPAWAQHAGFRCLDDAMTAEQVARRAAHACAARLVGHAAPRAHAQAGAHGCGVRCYGGPGCAGRVRLGELGHLGGRHLFCLQTQAVKR